MADEDEDRSNEEDFQESDFRNEGVGEELTDVEVESLKRELQSEISELEWEFKQVKELLYNERLMQAENKLSQAKSGTAPEFLHVVSLVEESYKIRSQNTKQHFRMFADFGVTSGSALGHLVVSVCMCFCDQQQTLFRSGNPNKPVTHSVCTPSKVAKYRMRFAVEVVNKEVDNELLLVECDAKERLLAAEEQIRVRLQESICKLQYERIVRGYKTPKNVDRESSISSDQSDIYLPSPNLEPRRKPVTLSPTTPKLIYQIPEKDIQSDIEFILAAVKKHKLAFAISQFDGETISL
ncbi:unnamed protein product [Trichobilharzia szidati]|nr:unnamed protein product [Trichobilharzia szidati]